MRNHREPQIVRFDINCDYQADTISQIIANIKINRYNSFGKGVYAIPEKSINDKAKPKAIRLTQNKVEKLSNSGELDKAGSLYIGNIQKSNLIIHVYDKKKQTEKKKKSFAALATRIEPRVYPKSFEPETEQPKIVTIEKQSEEVIPNTKQKHYQKIAEYEGINYSFDFYNDIMSDYSSDLSHFLRNIMYLNSMLNGFTINPNTKEKQMLTPWYLDTYIMPIFAIVESLLLEHPEFATRALPVDYSGEVLRREGALLAIREPKIVNGALAANEEEIRDLLRSNTNIFGKVVGLESVKRAPKKSYKSTQKIDSSKAQKDIMFGKVAVTPMNLSNLELQTLRSDLITYLKRNKKIQSEADFLEKFLRGSLEVKPDGPLFVKYETWRRVDKSYNLPWIKMKRSFF